MAVDVLLGLQWGDEGKGKIVDYLAPAYEIVARFQGGPNAGHTLKFDGKKYILHTIPSGIFREGLINLIGNGVVIDPITLEKEIEKLREIQLPYQDRLLVAKKAHLILPTHRYLDAASEAFKGKDKIGSTLKGIGPTYMDKTGRNGLRVGDLSLPDFQERYKALREKHLQLLKIYPDIEFNLEEEEAKWFESLKTLLSIQQVNGEYFINEAIQKGRKILAEGAQGSMLDIDYGTYPFVTSSNTITSGVCTGLGIAPHHIDQVIGISKAYCTRVGSGPFPTELFDQSGDTLREEGAEFGSTTGRPRRCGWLDLPQLKYTIMLNGVTQIALTKIDVLNVFENIRVALQYRTREGVSDQVPFQMDEETRPVLESLKGWNCNLQEATTFDSLPEAAVQYIYFLEKQLGIPITMVSTGPERNRLIDRRN